MDTNVPDSKQTLVVRVSPAKTAAVILSLSKKHLDALRTSLLELGLPVRPRDQELLSELLKAYWCFLLDRVFAVFGKDPNTMSLFNTAIRNHLLRLAPDHVRALTDDVMESAARYFMYPSRDLLLGELKDFVDEQHVQEDNIAGFRFLSLNACLAKILDFKKHTPGHTALFLLNGERLRDLPQFLAQLEPSWTED